MNIVKRKRINRIIPKFIVGDVVRATISTKKGGIITNTVHTCIITEENRSANLAKCVEVCNFTGTQPYHLNADQVWDVSEISLPESWFENSKDKTWLVCKSNDCVFSEGMEIQKLGNLKNDFTEIWENICRMTNSFKEFDCQCA